MAYTCVMCMVRTPTRSNTGGWERPDAEPDRSPQEQVTPARRCNDEERSIALEHVRARRTYGTDRGYYQQHTTLLVKATETIVPMASIKLLPLKRFRPQPL